MNDRIDADARLELDIAQAFRNYVAASREQQRPMWTIVEGLLKQRSQTQIRRMEIRMGLT